MRNINIFGIIIFVVAIGFSLLSCDSTTSPQAPQLTIDEIDFGVDSVFTTFNFGNAADLLNFWNDPNLPPGNYVINITEDINLGDNWLHAAGVNWEDLGNANVTISLRGVGTVELTNTHDVAMPIQNTAERRIILRNITINGGIGVVASSELVMETGSVITGGYTGVLVIGGSFTMNGGEIHGNSIGVVKLTRPSSHFRKTGGVIYGNVLVGKNNSNRAIQVLSLQHNEILYREDTVVDALCVTFDENMNMSQTGIWASP